MRHVAVLLLCALVASCGESPQTLRQVSIESPAPLTLSLRELPSSSLRSLGLPYGLAVVKAGNLAERAGLRVGDVVYAVNEQRIRNVEQFTTLIAAQPGGRIGLLVRRGGADFYVPMDLGAAAPRTPDGAPKLGPRDTLLRT